MHSMTSAASVTTLPPLSDVERAHAERVSAHIREFIAAQGGVIGFDAYMRLALYAPGLGYYSAGAAKLGGGGDFVTAPEISSLFSRCVARQAAEVLRVTGRRHPGARRGTRHHGGRRARRARGARCLPERYLILEVSADLAARQRARLARLPAALAQRVQWLERWPERPMRGVVLANEVLDAMPVERFVLRDRPVPTGRRWAWRAQAKDSSGGKLPPRPELAHAVAGILDALPAPLPTGYVSEVCLAFQPWIASLAAQLEQGVALLIDYGLPRAHLYHPQRVAGTLRCHFRHRAHDDPFVNVGCRTSPRGWISRASRRPPTAPASTCWASPPRRPS